MSNIQVGSSAEFVSIQKVGRRSRNMSYSVTAISGSPTVEIFGIVGQGQTSLTTGLTGNVLCEGYTSIGIKVTGPAVIDLDIQF